MRTYGVDHYVVESDVVRFYDQMGIETGLARFSVPADDRRAITIEMQDGSGDEVEVWRPLNGGFRIAVKGQSLSSALLLDSALEPVLSRFALRPFAAPTAGTPTDVDPSAYAACLPGNSASGCYNSSAAPCYSSSQVVVDSPDGAQPCGYGDWGIESVCGAGSAPYSINYWDSYGYNGPGYYCRCGALYTSTSWVASCPKRSCTISGQRDGVERDQSCTEPGSCYNTSAFVGCVTF